MSPTRMAAFLVALSGTSWQLSGEQSASLFRDVPDNAALAIPAVATPAVKRTRVVTVDTSLIDAQAAMQFNLMEPSRRTKLVALNLFQDLVFNLVLQTASVSNDNTAIWTGKIEDAKEGDVILVITDGVVSADVTVDTTGSYRVRYLGADQHVIQELDTAGFPGEASPVSATSRSGAMDKTSTGLEHALNGIEATVVYTPALRELAGGSAAVESLIQLAFARANRESANRGAANSPRLASTICEFFDAERAQSGEDARLNQFQIYLWTLGDQAFCTARRPDKLRTSVSYGDLTTLLRKCAAGLF